MTFLLSNNPLAATQINPSAKTCVMMESQTAWKWKVRQTYTSWLLQPPPKGDFGVRSSKSRLQYLPTHDSTDTRNHHRNYSIIHHPPRSAPFFCVISPILASLVKIFPWLMMCHRGDHYWTTARCAPQTWRTHHTRAWKYIRAWLSANTLGFPGSFWMPHT